jgi:hypothetical protein
MLQHEMEKPMKKLNPRTKPKTTKPKSAQRNGTKSAARNTHRVGSAGKTQSGTKIAKVISLLRGPKGATINALRKATGWQAHSVRGALAGAIKKKLGLDVVSEKTGDVRTYRIAS